MTSMPESAIATGLVDLVLPAEEMAASAGRRSRRGAAGRRTDDGDEAGQRQAREHDLRASCAGRPVMTFRATSTKTFLRRVQRRMQARQVEGLDDLCRASAQEPDEVSQLFRDLLISVTSFFRDADAVRDCLDEMVIPRMFENSACRGHGARLGAGLRHRRGSLLDRHAAARAWKPFTRRRRSRCSPRTSTNARWTWRAPGAIPRAFSTMSRRSGCRRYFIEDGDSYVVRKEVRELCIFSPHSVIRDPPFSRMDLDLVPQPPDLSGRRISESGDPGLPLCPAARRIPVPRGIRKHRPARSTCSPRSTRSTGCSAGGDTCWRRPVPISLTLRAPASFSGDRQASHAPPSVASRLRRPVEAQVLDRFAPAHVVVNQRGRRRLLLGRTGKYLEAPQGAPNRQLLAMARKGLRLDLRGALHEAMQTQSAGDPRAHRGRGRGRPGPAGHPDDRAARTHGLASRCSSILFSDVGAPAEPEEAYGRACQDRRCRGGAAGTRTAGHPGAPAERRSRSTRRRSRS